MRTLEKSPLTSTDLRICRSTVKVMLVGFLSARVMEEAEWKLLSQAVALYCGGKLSVHGNRVVIKK